MRILIVEHDGGQRAVMAQTLAADGHELGYADSCREAVRMVARDMPDLVLMDIALADGDGFQCAKRLHAMSGERLVPVVLSTSIADEAALRRFLDCGAADFIDAPHDSLALRAKISGHAQTHARYRHLESLRDKFHYEVRFAKHMFDAVLVRSPSDVRGLQHWKIAAGHFCGDLMIHEKTPQGRLNILLGDFTGHGLAAAIGAMPVSDIFFAMSRKGLPLGQIAAEINRKLHLLLPTGYFCAATLVSLDIAGRQLEAWVGGQPPLLLIDGRRRIAAQIASRHYPLGVVGDQDFDASTQDLSVADHDHLLLYSDGLLEACNTAGEMFGADRLAQALGGCSRKACLLQGIKSRLVTFLEGLEPHDDVSVLKVDLAALA